MIHPQLVTKVSVEGHSLAVTCPTEKVTYYIADCSIIYIATGLRRQRVKDKAGPDPGLV